MYRAIKDHPSTRELYSARLVAEGVVAAEQVDAWVKEFETFLDVEFEAGKQLPAEQGRLAGRQVAGSWARRTARSAAARPGSP
jgi:2-oxoglutarate dehydrogenase complex dehydrogenase (E1) component-like enzyme